MVYIGPWLRAASGQIQQVQISASITDTR